MPKIPRYITKSNKSENLIQVINEALYILDRLGVPLTGLGQRRLENSNKIKLKL